MKTSLALLAVTLFAVNAFAASYFVVLRDGTRYECKGKPTVKDGKAYIVLVSGPTLTLDPTQIDGAKSEEVTKYNGGSVLAQQAAPTPAPASQPSSLGAQIRLRKAPDANASTGATTTPPPPVATGGDPLRSDVMAKFERAYENVGIFEHKVTSTGPHSIRAELTADSEEKVFNAISATAFLAVRDAGTAGVHIDMIELFMKTTTGGSAGRFQMTRDDATALDTKQISKEDYYVRKVVY
jgi:hypothetical protein